MSSTWLDHSLSHEIQAAIAAVRKAGRLCRAVQAGIDLGELQKKDRSPVTMADFGSQAVVCRILGDAFPDDPVIGEEDSRSLRQPENQALLARVAGHVQAVEPDADARLVCDWIDRGGAKTYSGRFWTLDPIDGTKGFLRGQQYAIALALILEGRLEVAVLGCPNLGPTLPADRGDGTLLVAVRGAGVREMPLLAEGPSRSLSVSTRDDPTRIRFCESVEAAHSSHGDAARIAQALAIAAEPARLDSQAKYAVVARGEADAYLRLPKSLQYQEKIWDHAGGVLVVTEAGGRVTDIHGQDLDFSRGYLLENNVGVIVTNGRVHDAVLGAIATLGIGQG